jgi:hypothetical protein
VGFYPKGLGDDTSIVGTTTNRQQLHGQVGIGHRKEESSGKGNRQMKGRAM